MGRVAVRQLENESYRLEAGCYPWGEFVRYYLVTNTDRFKTRLEEHLNSRKMILTDSTDPLKGELLRKLTIRKSEIAKAFERTEEKPYVRIERVGLNPKRGLVDLIEIPVIDRDYNIRTAFEGQKTPMILFRVSYPKKDEQIDKPTWIGELTAVDLEYLTMLGQATKPTELTPMQNVFSEALDGSDLTMIKKLLIKRETNLSLRRLREAAEYTLSTLIKEHCLKTGGKVEDSLGRRSYAIQANELKLLSSSDFAQACAFMYAGNAAVHHDFLKYSRKNAILFFDWLRDFTQRTIGLHMIPKSRENGTTFSDSYELTTDSEKYRLRRALFDQLHALSLIEKEKPSYRDFLHLKDEAERLPKEIVMASAIKILRTIQTIKEIRFNEADLPVLEVFNFWERSVRNQTYDFTARDAARAAFFSGETFLVSKEIDMERLVSQTTRDTNDINQQQWVRKKGMTISRYKKYGFDKFKQQLDSDLVLVTKVIDSYFPDFRIVLDKE